MAVVTTKSGGITNRDATPKVKNNAILTEGLVRENVGTVEVASGDSIGSKYIMFQVPSNARVAQLLVSSDDIGTTTIGDIGLYKTTADGGAVVDADFFASALSLKDGALNSVDVTHESGVYDIDDAEKPLWSALGLTADPSIFYDVVMTLTAAADAAGTFTLKGKYVI
ncbi:MAG TPA: hypothetical protein PKC11_04715 [Agitococcus sp.]|nr:hypothetical protein [Agitococcus sp.]HMX98850.1 hypothetical protein [Agitococcus sp.]HNA69978.1 hypothetical protein [Nitrosomonas sp.]